MTPQEFIKDLLNVIDKQTTLKKNYLGLAQLKLITIFLIKSQELKVNINGNNISQLIDVFCNLAMDLDAIANEKQYRARLNELTECIINFSQDKEVKRKLERLKRDNLSIGSEQKKLEKDFSKYYDWKNKIDSDNHINDLENGFKGDDDDKLDYPVKGVRAWLIANYDTVFPYVWATIDKFPKQIDILQGLNDIIDRLLIDKKIMINGNKQVQYLCYVILFKAEFEPQKIDFSDNYIEQSVNNLWSVDKRFSPMAQVFAMSKITKILQGIKNKDNFYSCLKIITQINNKDLDLTMKLPDWPDYRMRLVESRHFFSAKSDPIEAQKENTKLTVKLLNDLLEESQVLLGEESCEIALLVTGSTSRYDRMPKSDVELVLLHEKFESDKIKQQSLYVNTLAKLIELSIIALNETPYQGEEKTKREGFRIDSTTHYYPQFTCTPDILIKKEIHKVTKKGEIKEIVESPVFLSLIKPKLVNEKGKKLFEEYVKRIKEFLNEDLKVEQQQTLEKIYLKNINNRKIDKPLTFRKATALYCCLDVLRKGVQIINNQSIKLTNSKDGILSINIKDAYYKPLTYLAIGLQIYHNWDLGLHPYEVFKESIEKKVCKKYSIQLLQNALMHILNLRIALHQIANQQNETLSEKLPFFKEDILGLEIIGESIIKPLEKIFTNILEANSTFSWHKITDKLLVAHLTYRQNEYERWKRALDNNILIIHPLLEILEDFPGPNGWSPLYEKENRCWQDQLISFGQIEKTDCIVQGLPINNSKKVYLHEKLINQCFDENGNFRFEEKYTTEKTTVVKIRWPSDSTSFYYVKVNEENKSGLMGRKWAAEQLHRLLGGKCQVATGWPLILNYAKQGVHKTYYAWISKAVEGISLNNRNNVYFNNISNQKNTVFELESYSQLFLFSCLALVSNIQPEYIMVNDKQLMTIDNGQYLNYLQPKKDNNINDELNIFSDFKVNQNLDGRVVWRFRMIEPEKLFEYWLSELNSYNENFKPILNSNLENAPLTKSDYEKHNNLIVISETIKQHVRERLSDLHSFISQNGSLSFESILKKLEDKTASHNCLTMGFQYLKETKSQEERLKAIKEKLKTLNIDKELIYLNLTACEIINEYELFQLLEKLPYLKKLNLRYSPFFSLLTVINILGTYYNRSWLPFAWKSKILCQNLRKIEIYDNFHKVVLNFKIQKNDRNAIANNFDDYRKQIQKIVNLLLNFLESDSEEFRKLAAKGIKNYMISLPEKGEYGHDTYIENFLKQTQLESFNKIEGAIEALKLCLLIIDKPLLNKFIKILINRLDKQNPYNIRFSSLKILVSLIRQIESQQKNDLTKTCVNMLSEEDDADVISIVITILGNILTFEENFNENNNQKIIYHLINFLESTSSIIRKSALEAISSIKHLIDKVTKSDINKIISILLKHLEDKKSSSLYPNIFDILMYSLSGHDTLNDHQRDKIYNKLIELIEDRQILSRYRVLAVKVIVSSEMIIQRDNDLRDILIELVKSEELQIEEKKNILFSLRKYIKIKKVNKPEQIINILKGELIASTKYNLKEVLETIVEFFKLSDKKQELWKEWLNEFDKNTRSQIVIRELIIQCFEFLPLDEKNHFLKEVLEKLKTNRIQKNMINSLLIILHFALKKFNFKIEDSYIDTLKNFLDNDILSIQINAFKLLETKRESFKDQSISRLKDKILINLNTNKLLNLIEPVKALIEIGILDKLNNIEKDNYLNFLLRLLKSSDYKIKFTAIKIFEKKLNLLDEFKSEKLNELLKILEENIFDQEASIAYACLKLIKKIFKKRIIFSQQQHNDLVKTILKAFNNDSKHINYCAIKLANFLVSPYSIIRRINNLLGIPTEHYSNINNQKIKQNFQATKNSIHNYNDTNIGNNFDASLFLRIKDNFNRLYLSFNSWYEPDICGYLMQIANKQNKYITIIFNDIYKDDNTYTFEKQLECLKYLSEKYNKLAIFIGKEPGATNHFICGLIIKNNLLFINSLGVMDESPCMQTFSNIKNKKIVNNILLSSNILQKCEYEKEGLVSCGPIISELVIHIIMRITKEELESIESIKSNINYSEVHDKSKTEHSTIDIKDFLPDILKSLQETNDEDFYKDKLCNIRQHHYDILKNLPDIRDMKLKDSTDEYLMSNSYQEEFDKLLPEYFNNYGDMNTIDERQNDKDKIQKNIDNNDSICPIKTEEISNNHPNLVKSKSGNKLKPLSYKANFFRNISDDNKTFGVKLGSSVSRKFSL